MELGDLSSYLALVVSLFALGISRKFNTRQKKFMENQELLNKSLLRQVDAETRERRQAEVSANLVRLDRSTYRFKIFNKGKAPARHVRVELLEGEELVVRSDLDGKFPLEVMQVHQGVDVIASVHMNSPNKMKVRLLWEDDSSSTNERVVVVTL
jgi:hypothetical protein